MINNLQRARVLEQLPRHFEADDPDDAFLLTMANADATTCQQLVAEVSP